MSTKPAPANANSPARDLDPSGPAGTRGSDAEAREDLDEAQMPVQDIAEAEASRPTLPEETADGLDDMDEEVRRQAEDMPLDTPGSLR